MLKKDILTNNWQRPSELSILQWSEIEVDLNDWESNEIIKRHNLRDAINSGLDISDLEMRMMI